jgi:hypothetical protein
LEIEISDEWREFSDDIIVISSVKKEGINNLVSILSASL